MKSSLKHLSSMIGIWVRPSLASMGLSVVVGCAPAIATNPSLQIEQARMDDRNLQIEVVVSNPGKRDLVLQGIEYQALIGPLPVASGQWSGSEALAPGARVPLSLSTAIEQPPLDPSASELELNGTLRTSDATSPGAAGIASSSFRANHILEQLP